MIEEDKKILKENGLVLNDKTHTEMVGYIKMFEQLMPTA
jgi:hypothetical protein